MRVPVSWLRDYVDLPTETGALELANRLTALGLKLETLESTGAVLAGPLVVGRVVSYEPETHPNGKTIRWCQVDVGESEPRGIVCGADNFEVADLVVVALPGAVLPGGAIAARKTYGHVSDGMVCSARELELGEDHLGIMVLTPRASAWGEHHPGGMVLSDADTAKPGDDAIDLLDLRDDVIELEINPDRAYALSLRGVAREAAMAYDVGFHDPADAVSPVAGDGGYSVSVEDAEGCPLFVAGTVTGFDPAATTPRWLARRVQLAGMRPISLAVDVTNFVMLELGQPIHGYDRGKLAGAIGVRRAAPGERLTTLDGVTRALDPADLLITDDTGPIGLAGVMGGETTEMGPTTTDVVIEAAHFSAVAVFRAARRHKLPSEASRRFERGVDPTLPERAVQRVAELLVEYGGGHIEGATVVGAPPTTSPISIHTDLPGRVSGIEIAEQTTVSALREIGCEIDVADGRLTAVPPAWRPDLQDPYDLVEEVVRIVGYGWVPSVLPVAPAGLGLTEIQRLRRRVGRLMAGSGYVEVVSYPFVGPADWERLGLPEDDPWRQTMRLANPLSDEEPELRTTVLPGLLRAAARNVSRGQADLSLFEAGSVVLPVPGAVAPVPPVDRRPTEEELAQIEAALPDQPQHLGVVLCGNREASGWWGAGRVASWQDALEAVRRVAAMLDVGLEVRAGARAPWHPGRCGELVLDGEVVGWGGELHPRMSAAFGLPGRVAAAEVDLDALLSRSSTLVAAPQLSSYPVAKEDVALVVDDVVPASAVESALRAGAGELLETLRLFDVYTGEQIGDGKKSLAFALRFRAPNRTLTEAETSAARDAAVRAAAEQVGAVQRA